MTLQDLFTLITYVIFSPRSQPENNYDSNRYFFPTPRLFCKDGFTISIQGHIGNYCSTENGYRKLGKYYKTLEWGFPSEHEELLVNDAEQEDDVTETVGSSTVELLQEVLDKHGGIDYAKTVQTIRDSHDIVEGQYQFKKP